MTEYNVIADSSFFILFLNDINEPSYLNKIIRECTFIITPRIREEISIKNSSWVEQNKRWLLEEDISSFKLEETFSLFISSNEELYKKGEYEIIALAYLLKDTRDFLLIIDEDEARNLIEQHLPSLTSHLCYSTRFIEICTCNLRIFKKEEALSILYKIEKSHFRVPNAVLTKIREEIREWK